VGHPIEQDGLTAASGQLDGRRDPLDDAIERALARLRAGDGVGAESALAEAPEGHDDVRLLHLRAAAAHLRGDVDAAERLISAALAATTDPVVVASLHNDLGNMRLEAGDPASAVEAYEASLAVQPDDAPTWANLATALRMDDDPVGAGRAGLRALELEPQGALGRAAVTAAVLSLTGRGREGDALDLVGRWVRLDPGHPGARHRLAALGGLPVPDRAPDDYVETLFDATADAFDPHLAGLRYRAPDLVVDRVAALVGEPAGDLDVADLGCGTGLVGVLVRPWAHTLVGCDLSTNMLRHAQVRGCYDVLQRAELGAFLRAQPTAYDLVVCADTLCYLGDLRAVTAAAAHALRPGGAVVATVERLTDPTGEWRLMPSGRYAHAEEHLRAASWAAGLEEVVTTPVHLRLEAGVPVEGLLWSARRPSRKARQSGGDNGASGGKDGRVGVD
jgi:predicted TPR repeat methyltransferase